MKNFCGLAIIYFIVWAPLVWAQGPSHSVALPETTGIVWSGAKGLRESTAAIMERSKARDSIGPKPIRTMPERKGPDRTGLPRDPASIDAASWPLNAKISRKTALAPTAPQTVTTTFTGATLTDTSSFPPDTLGVAGPTQFVVFVNGRLRSFNKTTGAADAVLNADPDVFFSSVMTPPVASNLTTDPRARYDRLTNRWFLTIIDVPNDGTSANRILLAVSDAASNGIITANTVWTFYFFQQDLVGTTPNANTGQFLDYPTLGVDANALYIGGNMFGENNNNSFVGTSAFVVKKSSVLNGGPIQVTAFRDLTGGANGSGPYTPQGADNMDNGQTAATPGYFIGVSNNSFGLLVARRISNPGGTPTISANMNITVNTTANPITVPHLGNTRGSNGNLDALDDRLYMATLRNNHLWTVHTVEVDSTGTASASGNRDGARWYELDASVPNATPSPVQIGTVYDSATFNQRSYWMPSIMVSGQGHAALGFSTAGTSFHIDAATNGRLKTDDLTTTQGAVLYTATTTAYNPGGDTGGSDGRRWGDYSYTSIDPTDDMTMWTIQQYCQATNSYAVRVAKLRAPAPASPASCAPSSVTHSTNNVNVTLTGTSTNGSGFFDPGSGFPNHIGAVVNGGGVTINSVTYTDPTHITLNVSVASDAAVGARTISVTNPDGQAITSAMGILTVNAAADLSVTQSGSPNPVAAGYHATYNLTVANQGPDSATGATLVENLPAGTTFVSANPAPSSQGPTTVTFNLGTIVKNQSVPVVVVVSLPSSASGTISALASVSGNEFDSVSANNSAMTLLNVLSDSDGDGIPDAWETAHSLDPNNPNDAGLDGDGDGFTNLEEYLADTDPRDSSSFWLAQVSLNGNDIQITFHSVAGGVYRVEKTDDLPNNSWMILSDNIAGTGSNITITDSSAVSNLLRFYRVSVSH